MSINNSSAVRRIEIVYMNIYFEKTVLMPISIPLYLLILVTNGRAMGGGDMKLMMDFIDDRLNKDKGKAGGNKGLPQLISNMEDFFKGNSPWNEFYGKGRVVIHPIIVVNSRLFGVRGINFIMQRKLKQRILESEMLKDHVDNIGDLLVIDYDMLILVVSWVGCKIIILS